MFGWVHKSTISKRIKKSYNDGYENGSKDTHSRLRKEIAQLKKDHQYEMQARDKTIKIQRLQHEQDLKGYENYGEDKIAVRHLREHYMPYVQEALEFYGRMRHKLNDSQYLEERSSRKDKLTENLLGIIKK